VRGSYKPVERVLLILSLIYFAYPVSAFLAHPGLEARAQQHLIPQFNSDPGYLVMIVGLIGTTITPWMQFYLQASIVEKGRFEARTYGLSRIDVIFGCIVTDVIAFFIVVACAATIFIRSTAKSPTSRKRPKPSPFRREVRRHPVRRGPGERVADVGGDSAAGHGLQHLRGPGLRIGRRPRFGEAKIFYGLYTR
jgi:hypothetical protein